MSDTREPSYKYIDRDIWAVLVIAIVGIGVFIVSNLSDLRIIKTSSGIRSAEQQPGRIH